MESDDEAGRGEGVPLSIALSGGGHRATMWGLGALLFLVDSDFHRRVGTIASVSGGSILNAQLATLDTKYNAVDQREFQVELSQLAAQVAGFPVAVRLFRNLLAGWIAICLLFGDFRVFEDPFLDRLRGRSPMVWLVCGSTCLGLLIGTREAYRRATLSLQYPVLAVPLIVGLSLYWPFTLWAFVDRGPGDWGLTLLMGVLFPSYMAGSVAAYLRGTLWSWWGIWVFIAMLTAMVLTAGMVWWMEWWQVLPWSNGMLLASAAIAVGVAFIRSARSAFHPIETRIYGVLLSITLALLAVAAIDAVAWRHEAIVARAVTWLAFVLLIAELASARSFLAGRALRATFLGVRHKATYGAVPGGRLPMPDAEDLSTPSRPWTAKSVKLGEIGSEPLHVFCATELTTGQPIFFSRDFVYNDSFGMGRAQKMPLHDAVQASANLPGAFAPRAVKSSLFNFRPTTADGASDAGAWSSVRRLLLTDGGVFNNMADDWCLRLPARADALLDGLTRLRKDGLASESEVASLVDYVRRESGRRDLLVLNGSGPPAPQSKPLLTMPGVGEFRHLGAALELLYVQTNANRSRELEKRFRDPEDSLGGAIIRIEQSPYDLAESLAQSDHVTEQVRQRANEAIELLDLIQPDVCRPQKSSVLVRMSPRVSSGGESPSTTPESGRRSTPSGST